MQIGKINFRNNRQIKFLSKQILELIILFVLNNLHVKLNEHKMCSQKIADIDRGGSRG